MKKYLMIFALMFSVHANAEKITTQLTGKVTYTNLQGKTKGFLPIRIFVSHDTEGSIINAGALEDCRLEIGKKDFLSLWTEADVFDCFATSKTVFVPELAIGQMFSNATSVSFNANEHYSRIDSMYREGSIVNVTNSGSSTAALRRFVLRMLGDVDSFSLLKESKIEITDERRAEKYTLTLTPKKVIRD